jgi:hypothetical protein
MDHFKLIPLDGRISCIEFDAIRATAVLEITKRSTLGETDVYRNGSYQCTVSHGTRAVWVIAQRKNAPRYAGNSVRRASKPFSVDPKAQFVPQPEMA